MPIEPHTLEAITRYWFNEYTAIPARTRGNIVISLSTTLGRFNHGRLHTVFCGKTSIVPDLCFNGAIIVIPGIAPEPDRRQFVAHPSLPVSIMTHPAS